MLVVVTLDGEFHDPAAPLLSADDLAAVRGDGIFETLLVRDGRPCLWDAHVQRLAQSAQSLDLPAPDDEDEQEPAGDLGIVTDLGMGAMDMGALLDDYELYPDEMLGDIAARLGFGKLYDELVGVTTP